MRSVNEMIQLGIDREDMSTYEELIWVQYWYDKYAAIGFLDTFKSDHDDTKEFNGKKFHVIREVWDFDKFDLCSLPMWEVKVEGESSPVYAMPDEICKFNPAFKVMDEDTKAEVANQASLEKLAAEVWSAIPSGYDVYDWRYKFYSESLFISFVNLNGSANGVVYHNSPVMKLYEDWMEGYSGCPANDEYIFDAYIYDARPNHGTLKHIPTCYLTCDNYSFGELMQALISNLKLNSICETIASRKLFVKQAL